MCIVRLNQLHLTVYLAGHEETVLSILIFNIYINYFHMPILEVGMNVGKPLVVYFFQLFNLYYKIINSDK